MGSPVNVVEGVGVMAGMVLVPERLSWGEEPPDEPAMECSGTPMRVTLMLGTPVALYGWPWIAFDGLVSSLQLRAYNPDLYRLAQGARSASRKPRRYPRPFVPLDRQFLVYAASVSIFEGTRVYGRTSIVKMPPAGADVALASRKRRRVDTASGEFRRWLVNLVVVPATRVVFYARGDMQALERLLAGIYNIGHKRAAGYGIVNSILIEEVDEDWSIVDGDGRATRPIPVDMLEDYEKDKVYIGTYKPPYWNKRQTTLLAAPGSRVKLKHEYDCNRH